MSGLNYQVRLRMQSMFPDPRLRGRWVTVEFEDDAGDWEEREKNLQALAAEWGLATELPNSDRTETAGELFVRLRSGAHIRITQVGYEG